MSTIIKDNFPLMSVVDANQAKIARKNNIPLFRGVFGVKNTDDFGREIFTKISDNTVVLGGAIVTLEHITNGTATFKPATLNQILDINPSVVGDESKTRICCFGVGTGGCGLDFGSVIEPNIKQRNILDMVPLRSGAAVSGPDADKYFLKKANADGTTYSWYLKEFNTPAPVIKSLWKDAAEAGADGTEILTEIFDSQRTEGIESFAEFEIKLNTSDVREYFESIGELDMARYNSLGLFTGYKVDIGGGVMDYVNVRLFSVTNMENRSVNTKSESTFFYRIYSLV